MKKTKTLLTVLFLGGLWGFLEATLGTILHLDIFNSIIFKSTAVMLPIAYIIMGHAYKKTGSVKSILFVGLIAASIKAVCFLIPGITINKIINPMVAIVLESAISCAAFAIVKPSKVFSINTLVSFMVVSIVFRTAYVGYSIATAVPFTSAYINGSEIIWNEIFEYIVVTNVISCGYCALLLGVGSLFNRSEKFAKISAKVEHFAYSPALVSAMLIAALAVTVIL